MIKVGDKLPEAKFAVMTAEGPAEKTTADIFNGKKVVLFAVPGAFTPTCHKNHLPGFLKNADAIKAKGVDTIAVTGVNDVFVMNAWKKDTGADGKIGLDLDVTARGLGTRSKRYSMLVDNGVVKSLNIEETPGTADVSGADAILKTL